MEDIILKNIEIKNMNPEFKHWVLSNAKIVINSDENFSMLYMVGTITYHPSNFEPIKKFKVVGKRYYDELYETKKYLKTLSDALHIQKLVNETKISEN